MKEGVMPGLRKRSLTVLLVAGAVLALGAAVVWAGDDGTRHHPGHGHHHRANGFPPNVDRLDLSGYKIEAKYTLGANTGSTFQQTYKATQVQGVPVAGPYVGNVFPPSDYVALSVAPHTVYIVWQDPTTHAILDAFVMNFKTGVVFDYAPGSANPESSGTIKVLETGPTPIP
jgi:hypothetical protein